MVVGVGRGSIGRESRRHARAVRTMLVTGAVLLAPVVLSACSQAPTSVPSDAKPAFRATGTPSPAVTPLANPPRDFRTIQGTGFSIQAPSAFQEKVTTSSNGEPMLVLRRPSSVDALPASVVVLRDAKPKQDVVEQSYALEVSKRALGAKDLTRSDVTWPGAVRTVLVQWTEQVAVGGGRSVPTRYAQLSAQISDALIVVVVTLAPVGDVDTSAVGTVLQTFRPSAALL